MLPPFSEGGAREGVNKICGALELIGLGRNVTVFVWGEEDAAPPDVLLVRGPLDGTSLQQGAG